MVVSAKPILYVCPYCTKGRFTEDDGWDGAVRHIKEKHEARSKEAAERYSKEDVPVVETDLPVEGK
jgi:hypothetical protein